MYVCNASNGYYAPGHPFVAFLGKLIGWLAMNDSCMINKAHDQLKL